MSSCSVKGPKPEEIAVKSVLAHMSTRAVRFTFWSVYFTIPVVDRVQSEQHLRDEIVTHTTYAITMSSCSPHNSYTAFTNNLEDDSEGVGGTIRSLGDLDLDLVRRYFSFLLFIQLSND